MTGAFVFDRGETIARLRESLATIESFLALVPAQWTHTPPPGSPEGAWSVAMNLAHLVIYEECIAAPLLDAMAAGGDGAGSVRAVSEAAFLEDAIAIAGQPLPALLERLRGVRARQIDAIAPMSDIEFNRPATPLFSARSAGVSHPASWVATKTFQHTWEHGNAILRVAMFAPR